MDLTLLKERLAFKKKALSMPTVEKRKIKPEDDDDKGRSSKKIKKDFNKYTPKSDQYFDYKSMTGSSQFNFGILAKIVKHMKERYRDGNMEPLTLEEILDETHQLDITARQKHWLKTEALINNPKIEIVNGESYKYKPKYCIKDKKALIRLLDKNDQNGLGGLLREDVEESLPHANRCLRILGDKILYVTRPDKKQVLFYNDKNSAFVVDEEIKKLWRSVTVEGVDERKIEEYLQKQGITSMQDIEVKRATSQKRRKTGKRKNKNFKSHNDHLGDILQDYSSVNK